MENMPPFTTLRKRLNEMDTEGVHYSKKSGKWVVRVKNETNSKGSKPINSVAQFDNKEEAENLYNFLSGKNNVEEFQYQLNRINSLLLIKDQDKKFAKQIINYPFTDVVLSKEGDIALSINIKNLDLPKAETKGRLLSDFLISLIEEEKETLFNELADLVNNKGKYAIRTK